MKCRHCYKDLTHVFLDLGHAPPSNAYLNSENLNSKERYYPLRVLVCDNCWLVQTEDFAKESELFDKDYAYFSSTSTSWLEHAKQYTRQISKKLNLNRQSFVIEVASNDGYLLKNFVSAGIPCIGIEPTMSTAMASESMGVPVIKEFFGEGLAQVLVDKGMLADLVVGNNVYAHVPDINDFTAGLKKVLKPNGVITLEFPHLKKLIELNQFDTIYHEHFSYLSLTTVNQIFKKYDLRIWSVEEIPTHGGSLRVYGCHDLDKRKTQDSVNEILDEEISFGLTKLETYFLMQKRVKEIKNTFIKYLADQKKLGKKIIGYGAAAKGSTLLNYAEIKTGVIDFICDAAISKQNKYMPGSHIQIKSPDALIGEKIDIVIIFPWNLKDEIVKTLKSKYGLQNCFVTFIPKLQIL